jgi:hypothetical protein
MEHEHLDLSFHNPGTALPGKFLISPGAAGFGKG